jgi:hypothetical protein
MEDGVSGNSPGAEFRLLRDRVIAIVPPSQGIRRPKELDWTLEPDEEPPLPVPVRALLLGIALALGVVFFIAWWLDPYERDDQGRIVAARRQETHRQLGLPQCSFYYATGLPCPSCGMTTSFALLMHGDILNSLRANAVGTLLALVGLLTVPWAVVACWRGRPPLVRSIETTVSVVVIVLFGLMLLRWIYVLISLKFFGG